MRKKQQDKPARASGSVSATCRRCGSTSHQMLHETPRLTLFKCADCGWRYALAR